MLCYRLEDLRVGEVCVVETRRVSIRCTLCPLMSVSPTLMSFVPGFDGVSNCRSPFLDVGKHTRTETMSNGQVVTC